MWRQLHMPGWKSAHGSFHCCFVTEEQIHILTLRKYNMATRASKHVAVGETLLERTLQRPVRRSSRNAPVPKPPTASSKKREREHTDENKRIKTEEHTDENKRIKTEEHTDENKRMKTEEHTDENKRMKTEDLKEKKKVEGSVSVQSSGYGNGTLSEYELERLKNIRENQAFLSAIHLSKVTEELRGLSQPKRRPPVRTNTAPKQVMPPRKSLRLQNIEADPSGTPVIQEEYTPPIKFVGPLMMDPVNMDEGSELPPQLLSLCSEKPTKQNKMEPDLQKYVSSLKKMTLNGERVAKVAMDRIFSAAFHPCSSSLLLAAGDKCGRVGLWNLGADWGNDGVLLFEPHTRPVSCLAFSRADPSLLSLSYDGSLRCMDVERGVFDDVYDIEEGLRSFDFLSHDCMTLVVGEWDGNVVIVDRRTPGNSHKSVHSLDLKNLRRLSVHPVQKHYFAISASNTVRIFDSRYLKKNKSESVCELQGHFRSVISAYFSPHTGNRILTSCFDDRIRVYDTSAMTADAPLLTTIRYNMQTGRWLSNISATWDPKQEDCFAVGSMLRPRQMQVFHESGRHLHTFMDTERLSTVVSLAAFHPSRNALLGCNSTGRVHLFTD